MAHIDLNNELPGIRGLMAYRRDTAKILNELAEVLLRDEHPTLSQGERELIATYVSHRNDCHFCQQVHGAMAGHYLQLSVEEVAQLKARKNWESLSEKMRALLDLAAAVQISGKMVEEAHIKAAKNAGATEREIHDTVLIAAAFCMFNRYVDGLDTWAPQDPRVYADRAPVRAAEGYRNTPLNS